MYSFKKLESKVACKKCFYAIFKYDAVEANGGFYCVECYTKN